MKKIDILKRKISPRALFCIPNDWLHFISKKNVAKLFVWNRNWFDALCLPMMTPKLKFEILLLSMFKSDGDIQETEKHSDGTSIRLNILSSQRQTKWKNERKEKKNAHRFNNSIKKILSNEIFPHYLSLVRKNQLCIWLDVLTCHKQWRQFGFALRRTSIYSSMGTNKCKQSVNLIGFLCHTVCIFAYFFSNRFFIWLERPQVNSRFQTGKLYWEHQSSRKLNKLWEKCKCCDKNHNICNTFNR